MATKYVYLSGKCKWAKLRKPDEKYDNFQLPLYMDKKSWELFRSLGLGLSVKEDRDTGEEFVTFKRPRQKPIKNEMVEFGPPKVLAHDNTPYDGLVGNGSEVTVKISVYDTFKGPGHRLETVRVEKLVEYNPPQELMASPDGTGPAIPF